MFNSRLKIKINMETTKYLTLPPFNFKVTSDNQHFLNNLQRIYSTSLSDEAILCDYHVSIKQTPGLRKYFKPQVTFKFDQVEPFKPLPENHAFAMFEWGLNWIIASNEYQYIFIHSAALAKNGNAILFPAAPGSGKSTLTCYLASQGWQLLSDEMALVRPETQDVVPFVRPICLKNDSIGLAKQWYKADQFSDVAKGTHKGDVSHVAPQPVSLQQNQDQAKIRGLVFPKYKKNSETTIYQLNQAQAFSALTENAFNYGVVGKKAFNTMTCLVEATKCFEVEYSDLADLQAFLEEEIL